MTLHDIKNYLTILQPELTSESGFVSSEAVGKLLAIFEECYSIAKSSAATVQKLKDDETINGGMIPKVDACLEAINYGVKKAHIIDGRIEHSILLEIFFNSLCLLFFNCFSKLEYV